MEVYYTVKANNAIALIAAFVESKNTKGSGNRFALKLESAINNFAKENVEYAKCYTTVLASLGFSCLTINNWVIAFKISQNKFIVYRII